VLHPGRIIARRAFTQPANPGAKGDRTIEEAHKLLDEVADMLTHMRRESLGGRAGQR
jgi:hypothetical protein